MFQVIAVSAAVIALGLAAKFDWQLSTIQLLSLEYDSIIALLSGGTWTHSVRVDVVRDAAIAVSLSYLSSSVMISTYRCWSNALTFRSSRFLFVAISAFVAVILMLFIYAFPSALLVNDHRLAVIAGELQYVHAVSPSALLRHWLWTYWLAILVYGAIVFGLFVLSFWGLRRFEADNCGDTNIPQSGINQDSPSRGADPIKGEGILPPPRV